LNKQKSNGKIWPYAIALSITLVFVAAVVTVIIANKLPVENSDTYMMGYHEADAKANELIEARIAFDDKFKVEYITEGLSLDNTVLKYRVTTLAGKPVDDAQIKVVITRPNVHKYDKELLNPSVSQGVYTFGATHLDVAGRWNIMAKIKLGDFQRFLNVKADTRTKDAYQY